MNYDHDFYDKPVSFPKEITETYEIVNMLSISKTGMVCSLKKKLPYAEDTFLLKRIHKKQYDPALYKKLSLLTKGNILYPLQEYHMKTSIYFIFPKLHTLSFLVRSGKMDFQKTEVFVHDIGSTLLLLHQAGIYHMDLSPTNILADNDGHFYLSDFSSAGYFVKKSHDFRMVTKRVKRTGSTPGFYPEKFHQLSKSPANFDVFGFSMILYLLLNQGALPDHPPSASFNSKSLPEIRQINRLLLQAMDKCNTDILDKDFFHQYLHQIFALFIGVKEQKSNFKITLPDFENSLFCSFTEPVDFRHFNLHIWFKNRVFSCSIKKLFTSNPMTIFKLSVFKKISIPKSLPFCQKIKMPSFYGLLIFCGFVFLFAVYHFISIKEPAQKHIRPDTITNIAETKEPSPKFFSEDPKNPIQMSGGVTGSSISIMPAETPEVSLSKETLDISGQGLYDTSFLSLVAAPAQVTTLFAEKNDFSSCHPLFSFENLKELYLNDNMICSTKGFSSFQKLEVLDLSENDLKDISELANIPTLKILDLSGQRHMKNISCLKKLKTLQYLILTNTNITKKTYNILKKSMSACTIIY